MKKLILGILIGVTLSLPLATQAEEIKSLIGRTIEGQFAVKLDGKQLNNPAIVIDGTSYLPVRAISEALGMDVKFDSNLGIELNAKEEKTLTEQSTTQMSQEDIDEIAKTEERIAQSKSKISDLKVSIADLQSQYDASDNSYTKQSLASQIEVKKQVLDGYEQGVATLEANIEKIKAKYK